MTDTTSVYDPYAGGLGFFSQPQVGNPALARQYLARHDAGAKAASDQYEDVMRQRQSVVDNANRILNEATQALRARHDMTAPGMVNLPLLAMGAGFLKPTATHSFGEELSNALTGLGGAVQRQRMSDDQYNEELAKLGMEGAQIADVPMRDKAAFLKAQEQSEENAKRYIEQAQIRTGPMTMKPISDGQGGFLLPDGKGGYSHLDGFTGKIAPVQMPGQAASFTPGGAPASGAPAPATPADQTALIKTLPSNMQPTDPNDHRNYGMLAKLYADDPDVAREIWSFSQGLTNPDELVSMRQNRRERLGRMIMNFDNTWTPTQGKLRADVLKDMAPKGTIGKNIISNNTLMEHTGILMDDMAKMHESGSPLLNAPINWAKANILGDPLVSDFRNQQQIVATELARQLKGGEPSQAEIEHQLTILNENSSPSQMQSYAEHIIADADARKRQVLDQAAKVLGRNASLMPDHKNAEAEAAKERILNNPLPGSETWKRQQAAKIANARSPLGVPQGAIDYLKAHPDTGAAFDEHFKMPGAAQRILGGQ